MHTINALEIDSAIQDLDRYVMENMRTRSNPQMHLADLGEQDLTHYQVAFVSVKGEMEWKSKDLIAWHHSLLIVKSNFEALSIALGPNRNHLYKN